MDTYIEYPVGSRTTQSEFPLGALIKVQVMGGPTSEPCQMTIVYDNPDASPAYNELTLSLMGNGWFVVQLPAVVTKGTITTSATGLLGHSTNKINIGIGEVADPTDPLTNPSSLLTEIETILKWVAIGAGVVGVAYLASKALPSITEGIAKSKKKA